MNRPQPSETGSRPAEIPRSPLFADAYGDSSLGFYIKMGQVSEV